MSKTIDQRVVEMRFDNANFEKNVSTSMSTLDKLKKSLKFEDSAKGFENISKAAGRVDMGGLSNGVESVRLKFSAIVFDVGTLDLSMFAVIQDHLFTPTCANCHGGGSGNPAGNLNLMPGKSYVSLVDEASHKLPDVKRVQPGNAEESLLYQVVMEQHEGWGYNHYGLLTQTPVLRTIIKDWIDGGASR